ncbi:MAG: hypothetical protein LBK59_04570 [Bifidobacteriaceae bacterium]|nr:hypothetical protein [Bifidobacteriaceae bacterium]
MIGRFLAPVLVGLGACTAACAVASATLWRPADQVEASVTAEAAVLATAPGILDALADSVEVRIVVPDGGTVVAAIGRDTDVAAWIGSTPAAWLTGFASATQFTTATEPPAPLTAPTPDDDGRPGIAEGSDLWVSAEVVHGEGAVSWERTPGRWSLLIAPAGRAPAADASVAGTAVSMTWPRTVTTPWVAPGLVLAIVLVLAGAATWLTRRRRVAPGLVSASQMVPAGSLLRARGTEPPPATSGPASLDDDAGGACDSQGPTGRELEAGAARDSDELDLRRRSTAVEARTAGAESDGTPAAATTLVMSVEAILAAVEAGTVAGLTRRQIREAEQAAATHAKPAKDQRRVRRGSAAGRDDTGADPAVGAPKPASSDAVAAQPVTDDAPGDAAGVVGPDVLNAGYAPLAAPAYLVASLDTSIPSRPADRQPSYAGGYPPAMPRIARAAMPGPAVPMAGASPGAPAAGSPPGAQARAGLPGRPPGATPEPWSPHGGHAAGAAGAPGDAIARARGFLASLGDRDTGTGDSQIPVPAHPMSVPGPPWPVPSALLPGQAGRHTSAVPWAMPDIQPAAPGGDTEHEVQP